jgi:hypothetical protein
MCVVIITTMCVLMLCGAGVDRESRRVSVCCAVGPLGKRSDRAAAGTQFTCFTSANVLTSEELAARYSVYLLYKCQSINTDTP